MYFLIKTKIVFISKKKWKAWIILEWLCLNPFFFFTCSEKYVYLAGCDVIYGFSNTTCECHVIYTIKKTWCVILEKIIICLNYLVNVVLEELFEPFFILVINKKKIIFNFWMWFMICCFCMKSVKMQFKCLISDALGHGLIEVMDCLWLFVIVALFVLFFVKLGDKITWWKKWRRMQSQ